MGEETKGENGKKVKEREGSCKRIIYATSLVLIFEHPTEDLLELFYTTNSKLAVSNTHVFIFSFLLLPPL